MEKIYTTMRIEEKVLKRIQKHQERMRKKTAGDVVDSMSKLLDQQKSWGELK